MSSVCELPFPTPEVLDEHADRLSVTAARAQRAALELRGAVAAARDDGVTWQAIGEWLGMPGHGAYERFRRHTRR